MKGSIDHTAVKSLIFDQQSVYRGHIARIDGISQITHIARSVRRLRARHPNLAINVNHVSSSVSRRDDRDLFSTPVRRFDYQSVFVARSTGRRKKFY
ncbi:hypothetical protein ACTXT7_012828 [Hymenolepis weldensis]